MSDKVTINLGVFESQSNKCCGKYETNIEIRTTYSHISDAPKPMISSINKYRECDHLNRMIHALQYYQLLNIHQNTSNIHLFMHFCMEIYKELLNDYQHIITIHGDQLETINQQLINNNDNLKQCHHSNCMLFKRYYNNSRTAITNESSATSDSCVTTKFDGETLFFCELFDNIHHWLYHLYDVGMRVKSSVINHHQNNDEKNDNEDDDQYVDHEFRRIMSHIRERKEKVNVNLNRRNDQNNRFKLQMENNDSYQHLTEMDGNISRNALFMDLLLEELNEENISQKTVDKLYKYLEIEDFESDSIIDDVMNHQSGSNIIADVCSVDDKMKTVICDFVDDLDCM